VQNASHTAACSSTSRDEQRGYSIDEFSTTYRICRAKAYDEIKAGRLKIRKVGRRTIIAVEDAEDWFAACAIPREARPVPEVLAEALRRVPLADRSAVLDLVEQVDSFLRAHLQELGADRFPPPIKKVAR
jgi:hypothetical protein